MATLNFTDLALVRQIKEGMSIVDATLEPIDNAFDSKGVRNIHINFDEKEKAYIVRHDGTPMKTEDMAEFGQDFIFHKDNIGGGTIGLKGQGAKICAIKLGDTKNRRVELEITAREKRSLVAARQKIIFKESENNDCMTSHPVYPITNKEELKSIEDGQTYKVIGCVDELFNEEIQDKIKEECSNIYGFNHFKSNVNIYFNGDEVKYKDYMCLQKLGDKINTDSDKPFKVGGVWFKVAMHTFTHVNDPSKEFKFKTISLYIPRSYIPNRQLPDGKGLHRVGIYTFRGNRLMDYGGNIDSLFKGITSITTGYNTGGANRCRLGIITDYDVNNVFNIGSNKSKGVMRFIDNFDICFNYRNKDGHTPLEVIGSEFVKIVNLNTYERGGSKDGEQIQHPITQEVANEKLDNSFCLTICLKHNYKGKLKESKPQKPKTVNTEPSTIVEDIIETNNVDNYTKMLLYTLLNNLEKQKVTTAKIEKIIDGFYKDYTKEYKDGTYTEIQSQLRCG